MRHPTDVKRECVHYLLIKWNRPYGARTRNTEATRPTGNVHRAAPWRSCFSLRSLRTHSAGLDGAARGCSAKRRSGRASGDKHFLVRLSSDHIAKRAVVADPNLTLIRAETPGTADVGGIAPNDLCVVAADLPLPTGVFPVVVRRALCGPVGYDVILTDPLALATAIAPDEPST